MDEMIKSVYISGPITGTTDFKERFAAAEIEVRTLGYTPINPADWNCPEGLTWEEYMKRDIRLLLTAQGIYMLNGWFDSRGARIEQMIAQGLGMLVLHQPENFPALRATVPKTSEPLNPKDFDKALENIKARRV